MTHIKSVMVMAAVVSMFAATAAVAQQPTHQHDAAKPPAAATPSMPGPGTDAHMAHHMEMCRQMMGQGGMMGGSMGPGTMGPGMMMGMPMMMAGDPKQQAEMLAMRGEMMKAMGDIMMKYAQRAQPVK